MLQRLPLDTQKDVLGFLDAISLLSLARVNRHFRDLIEKQESLQTTIALHALPNFLCSIPEQRAVFHNLEDWITHFLFSSSTSKKSATYKRAQWERIHSCWSELDSNPRKKHLVKIIVIGESGVGKTSLAQMYVYKRPTNGYRCTIGTDFWLKEMKIRDHLVTTQIWDTAGLRRTIQPHNFLGQERFQSLGVGFFRGADAVIVTYDVMRSETFQAVEGWINIFREFNPDSDQVPIILCGNKLDLLESYVPPKIYDQQNPTNQSPFTAKGRRRRNHGRRQQVYQYPKSSASAPVEESRVWELAKRLHLPWIQTR